jgi:hypothetical protein
VTPGRADAALVPDAEILQRVDEHEYLWEMENALLNYVNRRHNPTRHALAYCISSPGEQRQAVAAMRERPPRLIVWQFVSGSNNIPNPLRFYVISQFLYQRYRPASIGGFLEPAGEDWHGAVDLPPGFHGALPLGLLASTWGRDRAPRLRERLVEERTLDVWEPTVISVRQDDASSVVTAPGWHWEGCMPSGFNYLAIDISCSVEQPREVQSHEAVLMFAPPGRDFHQDDGVVFRVTVDGVKRPYLLPVGCSPGWSWRPEIGRIVLIAPRGCRLARPDVNCWRVDELGE